MNSEIFVLGDRHGYDSQGVDTLHRDLVRLVAEQHYDVELTEEQMRDVLGTFENPNNVVEALEYEMAKIGRDFFPTGEAIIRDNRTLVVSLGDLVCSRKPGEMKVRNLVGKAAKQSRNMGVNQGVALHDLVQDKMLTPEGKDEIYALAKKFSDLTRRRFEALKGIESYLDFTHLVGNADILPSFLIDMAYWHNDSNLNNLVDIYRASGVFSRVVDCRYILLGTDSVSGSESDVLTYLEFDEGKVGLVCVPYSDNFTMLTHRVKHVLKDRIKEDVPHILFTHETLDTNIEGGDGRNVEGRECYNYMISKTKPVKGFSGDLHAPTQDYEHKVGNVVVPMTQVSTNDVVKYDLKSGVTSVCWK
ncbi:MAG: hypothetical protein ABIG89_03810 [Candidatus Woesearchaeota archaeon]